MTSSTEKLQLSSPRLLKVQKESFINSIEVARRCSDLGVGCGAWEHSYYNVSCPDRSKDEEKTPPFVSAIFTHTSGQEFEQVNYSTQTEPSIPEPMNCTVDFNLTFRGTPRKEKSFRRSSRTNASRIMDLCPWIVRKVYQSITKIYSELQTEPVRQQKDSAHKINEELEKITKKLERLERENKELREEMGSMRAKMNYLEGKLSQSQRLQSGPQCAPPSPSPPPPTPPPPPPPARRRLVRSTTTPKSGSTLPRIIGFRITPQDIANVKLRKIMDNPARTKHQNKEIQPLVTQQMLQTASAQLRRTKPVATPTPKQQLLDLENQSQRLQSGPQSAPPSPSPPPPTPPPPPPPARRRLVRSTTTPKSGSTLPRIIGFRITPQDIANVKLRKIMDNPARTKPQNKEIQPLVTQQMLQTARAKLRLTRPVATSTPKQQLSDLEKDSFRSAEE